MSEAPTRKLLFGNNLEIMRQHIDDESIALVYLDIPFNSNLTYDVLFEGDESQPSLAPMEAFDDTRRWTLDAQEQWRRERRRPI